MTPYDFVKLGVLVVVIGWCLQREAHHILLGFVGFALGSDWVQVDLGPTLTAAQIVGLMFLPRVPKLVNEILRTSGGRTFVAGLALLVVLAVIYGYIWPWPDKTGERPWTQRAEGRSIVNFGATLSYASLALYIAHCARQKFYRERIHTYLLIGTTIASLGVMLEVITQFDVYSFLMQRDTPSFLSAGARARGFNDEPRSSGSLAAMGIVLLLRPGLQRSPKAVAALLLHALALMFTTSTLGLSLLVIGVTTLMIVTRRLDILAAITVVSSLTVLSISAWLGDTPFEMWRHYAGERVAVREELIGVGTLEERLVHSLEVFDGSALNFLLHHPEHFVVGVGPGLVSLPASDYVPSGNAQAIFGDRIDSIPFTGFLRLISDSGVVGLGLWLLNVFALYDGLARCARAYPKDPSWRDAKVYLLVFAALYMFQTRPAWYVWLGVGFAGSLAARELEQRAAQAARERQKALTAQRLSAPRSAAPGT